jgi:riboflavin biosynthesis pyrimidine reductase
LTGDRLTPAELTTAADVDALARALYGASPHGDGVVHVTALCEAGDGEPRTLLIGPDSPRSDHDFFALNLARARADAILVTGKVLRAEPTLRYDLQGKARAPAALAAWRREIAGRDTPPLLCVLTSGRGLDVTHPAFTSWATPLVFTSPAGAERLADAPFEVVPAAEPSARAAVTYLREQRAARCVSIEAGPSTSRSLYDEPALVSELLLSLFLGAAPAHVVGEPLVPMARVHELLGDGSPHEERHEPSGPWRFQRFLRA